MKALIIGRSSNAGGGPTWALTLARGLRLRGHECRIIFSRLGTPLNFMHERAAEHGFLVPNLCYRFADPTYPRDLAAFIDEWQPDAMLIDNHERIADVSAHSARLQTRQTRVVFIDHCYGTPIKYLRDLQPYLSGMVCVSQKSADRLTEFSPTVIRNTAAFLSSTESDPRSVLSIPRDAFVIGYIGRFDHNKGLSRDGTSHFLYEVARDKPWWVLLAGAKAPEPPPSMTDRVACLSKETSRPSDLYRALDVYVLPSLTEGFPIAPMEALLCGTRVAMTPTSDYPDLFKDAVAFFDHGDVTGCAHAIETAPDPALGQRIIAERLPLNAMLDQYEAVLFRG